MIKGLPERLKDLRKKNGYSQREVAERLNVSKSVVAAYEVGDRTPSMEVLLSISYLYNCSTDFLLGRKQGEAVITIDTDNLTDEQIEALSALIKFIKK